MKRNYLKEAIDVLNGDFVPNLLLVEIAKSNPSAIVKAAEKLGYKQSDEPWMVRVKAEIKKDRKIHAIKEYRTWSGMGLKESKEAVEALMIEMGV